MRRSSVAQIYIAAVFVIVVGCDFTAVEPDAENPYASIGFSGDDFATSASSYGGGLFVSGYTNSVTGNFDIYILKCDWQSKVIWSKTFGGSLVERTSSIIADGDGGALCVSSVGTTWTARQIVVLHIDRDGRLLWTRELGGAGNDEGSCIARLQDGTIVVAGTYEEPSLLGANMYVARLTKQGDVLWERSFGGVDAETVSDVSLTSDNKIVLVGTIVYTEFGGGKDVAMAKVDTAGNVEWLRTYNYRRFDVGQSVIESVSGGYIVSGTIETSGLIGVPTDSDILVLRTDVDGNVLWQSELGETMWDYGYDVLERGDGQIVVCGSGYYDRSVRSVAGMLKSDGTVVWYNSFDNQAIARAIAEDRHGRLRLVGYTRETGAGDADVYITALDADGSRSD